MKNNIYRLLLNPMTLFFVWVFYLLTPLLGRTRFYVYSNFERFNLIRIVFYLIYRLLPYTLLIAVVVLVYMWAKNFNLKKLQKKYIQSLWMIFISSLASFITSQFMIYREQITYPNYLYSTFGVTLSDAKFINVVCLVASTLSASIIFINYFKLVKIRSDFRVNRSSLADIVRIITPVAAFLAIFILLEQSLLTLTKLKVYKVNASQGYKDKFGLQYKYVDVLVKETPKDSVVITPPQGSKWPSVGNQPVLRFFLYPRRLVSGTLFVEDNDAKAELTAYFVEIDPNIVDTHWPIIDTENKKIIFNEINRISYNTLHEVGEIEGIKTYKITF